MIGIYVMGQLAVALQSISSRSRAKAQIYFPSA